MTICLGSVKGMELLFSIIYPSHPNFIVFPPMFSPSPILRFPLQCSQMANIVTTSWCQQDGCHLELEWVKLGLKAMQIKLHSTPVTAKNGNLHLLLQFIMCKKHLALYLLKLLPFFTKTENNNKTDYFYD